MLEDTNSLGAAHLTMSYADHVNTNGKKIRQHSLDETFPNFSFPERKQRDDHQGVSQSKIVALFSNTKRKSSKS